MEYWIIYDLATGQDRVRGSGSTGMVAAQVVPEGCGIVRVPPGALYGETIDLAVIREAFASEIDAEAEVARTLFITALPGQVGAYLLKANAARRWLADEASSTAMLQPEATARGLTLEALCAEVLQREADWEGAAGPIEGIRLGAKAALSAATTLGAIVAARRVDWSAINAAARA